MQKRNDSRIYLDHNASVPFHPKIRARFLDFLKSEEVFYGNPDSIHHEGREFQKLCHQVTRLLKDRFALEEGDQVYFFRSASEANEQIAQAWKKSNPSVEFQFNQTPHDSLLKFKSETTPTGVMFYTPIQPETGICSHIQFTKNSPIHTDGAASWGKLETSGWCGKEISSLSLAPYKLGSLPGVGLLLVRSNLLPQNVSQYLSSTCDDWMSLLSLRFLLEENIEKEWLGFTDSSGRQMRDEYEKRSREAQLPLTFVGSDHERAGNVSLAIFRDPRVKNLVGELDARGFSVSSGSACKSNLAEPLESVLELGFTMEEAKNTLRISFGLENEKSDPMALVESLKKIFQRNQNA